MRSYPPPIEYPAGNNGDHDGALSGLLHPNRFDVADFARAQGLAYQRATGGRVGREETFILAISGNDGTVAVQRSASGEAPQDGDRGVGSQQITNAMTHGGGSALRGGYCTKAVLSYYKRPIEPNWLGA